MIKLTVCWAVTSGGGEKDTEVFRGIYVFFVFDGFSL